MSNDAAVMDAPVAKTFNASDDKIRQIPLAQIVSNAVNPRDPIPTLSQMGYGVFVSPEGSDKKPLVDMANGTAEEKKNFLKLLEQHESDVVELSGSMIANGQLHPARVRVIEGGGGYDLTFGCRRYLAALYNHLKHQAKAVLDATVNDNNETVAEQEAFAENHFRLNMNPMEQARYFGNLKNKKLSVDEMAKKTKMEPATIRNRLALLKLSQADQVKVEKGELTQQKAIDKIKKEKAVKSGKAKPGAAAKEEEKKLTAPTMKQWQTIYETGDMTVKDKTVKVPEPVRRFVADNILGVEYKTVKEIEDLKKAAGEAEEAAETKE